MHRDRPLTWAEASEFVCVGLFIAATLRVVSGVIQYFNAVDGTSFRDRVVELSSQLNPVTAALMVGAALVAVRAPIGAVRVGIRVALFRMNTVLAVVSGFAVLTILSIDRSLANKLLSVTRATLPGMVLFVLAAWLARNVVNHPDD